MVAMKCREWLRNNCSFDACFSACRARELMYPYNFLTSLTVAVPKRVWEISPTKLNKPLGFLTGASGVIGECKKAKVLLYMRLILDTRSVTSWISSVPSPSLQVY